MSIIKGKTWIAPAKGMACVAAVLFMSGLSQAALASCSFSGGVSSEVTKTVSFGKVTVQRDSPIGTVLATQSTGAYAGGAAFFGCTTAWVYRWENTTWPTLSSYGNGVYNTNIAGVGIRITNGNGKVTPYDQPAAANEYILIPDIKVELIKTKSGAVGAGTIPIGIESRASIASQFYTANVSLTGTNTIVPVACSVTNTSIPVPMGDIPRTSFTGVGSSSPEKSFSIPLNCDATTRVNVTLDGTRHSSGIAGLLALDPSASDTVASGVGLQLLFKSAPVSLGSPIAVGTVASDGAYSVPFTARYYQTGATVGGGKANSTATFTMTYQ
ncbi:fimbrial protein [Pseudomonas sp. Bout1]|jgi:type 1 fimbria pilin|uniref:fimbrial protein n=1 Tax=Pseudomonas sp. Bout1 TaxID=3048600 RepID=UPI002B222259|nr:fimbrial protein [Pseudomonas sp. Bout1]MEB0183537.1 fimbrial protein [Pseudomonas sp. Bout1]